MEPERPAHSQSPARELDCCGRFSASKAAFLSSTGMCSKIRNLHRENLLIDDLGQQSKPVPRNYRKNRFQPQILVCWSLWSFE